MSQIVPSARFARWLATPDRQCYRDSQLTTDGHRKGLAMWGMGWFASLFRVDQCTILRQFIEPLESRCLLSFGATLQYETWPQTASVNY
ncbi:MAG: hypothetical protein ACREJC_19010 [Tepidisphaeraceae bacterium]